MGLDSLLASLKLRVAEVTEVQASSNVGFACNPASVERVAGAAGVTAEIQAATYETPTDKSEVTARPSPIEACTHETPVTPNAIRSEAGVGDTVTASRGLLIHSTDLHSVKAVCRSEAIHAENLKWLSDAVVVETMDPIVQQPSAPLTAEVETLVRPWLTPIKVSDSAIGAAADTWRRNRSYVAIDDDRRTCDQCANLIGGRCQAAKRGEIVAARGYEPIRDLPRRCEGYSPGLDDPDRRTGRERWPALVQKGDA